MRKWVILHGYCIVLLIIVGIILTPFFLWKLYQIKKNYTKLHDRVNKLEGLWISKQDR